MRLAQCRLKGTPEGVVIFREPPVPPKHCDVFEVESLGTLGNTFINPE